jgi:hypothetical protein
MTTTAIALFDRFSAAQHVVHRLVAQGIRSEDITITTNRQQTSINDVLVAASCGVNVDVGPASRGQPAALIALGVPAHKAQDYAMVIDSGGTLVTVAAAEDQVERTLELMEQYMTNEIGAWAMVSEPILY